MNNKNSWGDELYLVVGAAGNLGPVWCKALLEKGASVLGIGLNCSNDSNIQALLSDYPDNFKTFEADITQTLPERLVETLVEIPLSGVVMNSGIDSVPGSGKSKITDYSFNEWVRMLTVNVAGVANGINQLIPFLKEESSVVLIGSMYGIVSPKPTLYSHYMEGMGTVKNPAYGASKAALIAMCKQYATHLAPKGIRFNLLTAGGVAGNQDEEFVHKFINQVPLGRMGEKVELTPALLFLLSSDSSYITGHNLVADGGYTNW